MDKLENQPCPVCFANKLMLTEDQNEVPFFGIVYLFSMNCSGCGYNLSDVEFENPQDPTKYTFTIENKKDLNVRVIKSSAATIKIPQLRMSSSPGPSSIGYVSNIEGLLERFEKILEEQRDVSEEPESRKQAKNLLKKIRKVKFGDAPLKIIIEDPSGNSAIISDKASKEKFKEKKSE